MDPSFRFAVLSTDRDWFRFLRSRPELDEINFWRPGQKSVVMSRGTPWLFLLRGTNDIVGFGLFSAFSVMPIGIAWDTFGYANGFPDYRTFAKKIARIKGLPENGRMSIGCAVLSSPRYFDPPIDFSPFGRMYGPVKSFDASTQEGARLWESVSLQAMPLASPLLASGRGKRILVTPRIGQATFRIELEREYQTRCAISGERTRPALEAAHIKPYSLVQEHALPNGLLLRSDLHKLFDQGYLTVTPDRKVRVSRAIREEFENGRDYYALEGRPIRDTLSSVARPADEYLNWHSSEVFKP